LDPTQVILLRAYFPDVFLADLADSHFSYANYLDPGLIQSALLGPDAISLDEGGAPGT
jgi:hypothetical protein